ncbi:MAG: aspartate/glutamate racemase family protein [Marinobacterium sp.]|nr:aspartate/glutamate racemase family protein [Marinobacterium sp.]
MKTIGLLGGMSWESTLSYYRALNEGVKKQCGGLNSAKIVLNSVNFAELEVLQHQERWDEIADTLTGAARNVASAGADFLLICTNTMHKVAPQIEQRLAIPLLHIADATAQQLQADGIQRVGLLGTAFTMEQSFYKGRLSEQYGIEVLVPDAAGRTDVHRIIYNELCLGQIQVQSRQRYLEVIDHLHQQGAEAIILGCTEIALLIKPQHTDVPLYDTTAIHAQAALECALSSKE